jgi:hypothetical protein
MCRPVTNERDRVREALDQRVNAVWSAVVERPQGALADLWIAVDQPANKARYRRGRLGMNLQRKFVDSLNRFTPDVDVDVPGTVCQVSQDRWQFSVMRRRAL